VDAKTVDADATINGARIGRFQFLVLVLGALILFTDGFNTQDIGYILPDIARDWGLRESVLGMIPSAGIFGLLVGYFLLAPLAGRFGQKRMVILSVAAYGAMSLLSATAADVTQLILLRFLTGVALASAIPSTIALIGEYVPMRRRSSFITFSYFGLSLGQLSAGAASAFLLDDYGWRAVFVAGGAVALALVPVLLIWLPESVEYLVNRGRQPERAARILSRAVPAAGVPADAKLVTGERRAQRVSVKELFEERRTLGTVLIWLALMMNLIPNYFFGNWLTKILIDAGFTQDTAIYLKMLNDGAGMIAAFLVGPLMDRFGPYRVLTGVFLVGAAAVSVTGTSLAYAAIVPLTTMCICVGLCTSSVQKGSNALAVHFYPTALRSAGLGWGLGVGRISAFLTPVVAGVLLERGWPAPSLFYLAAIPMLVGAAGMLVMYRIYGVQPRAVPAPAPAPQTAVSP
jgi:AAHS family 4-hydroxybenzoate transporter-like MFS transporter